MKMRTQAEINEILTKVKELRATGKSLHESAKMLGFGVGSYYAWLAKSSKPAKKAMAKPASIAPKELPIAGLMREVILHRALSDSQKLGVLKSLIS